MHPWAAPIHERAVARIQPRMPTRRAHPEAPTAISAMPPIESDGRLSRAHGVETRPGPSLLNQAVQATAESSDPQFTRLSS